MKLNQSIVAATLFASSMQLAFAAEIQLHEEQFNTSTTDWSWSTVNVSSNEDWEAGSYGERDYAVISGYNADTNSDDWLVSPSINLSGLDYEYVYAQFDNAKKYDGSPLKLMLSTDYAGDVATANWIDISEMASWSAGDFEWVGSGRVNISDYIGQNIVLAFHYTGTPTVSAKWEIDFVEVYNTSDITGEEEVSFQPRYLETFSDDNLGRWEEVSLASNKGWYRSEYNDNGFAKMSGYQGDENSNDWLIAPSFDMSQWEEPYFQFSNSTKYNGNPLKVLISNDFTGDVEAATWTDLSDQAVWSGGNYDWAESGRIMLTDYVPGTVGAMTTIAFQYTSSDAGAATWQIDNLDIGSRYQPGVVSPTNTSEAGVETFETGLGVWVETSISGSKTWSTDDYNGANFAKLSGFGDNEMSDDWLVSPSFDMTDWTNKTISFFSATKFGGPGLELLVSTDDNFTGNVTETNWVDISDRVVWSEGDYEWVSSGSIDVSDLVSENATFAFHYTSDDSGAATWQIESISVGGASIERETQPNYTTYMIEEFSDTLGEWTAFSLASDKNWETDSYIDTTYASISGYGGDMFSDDWLVSTTVNTTTADWDKAFFQFKAAKKYDGENLKLLVSTDYTGDVSTATWTDISVAAGLAKVNAETGEVSTTEWDGDAYEWIDSGAIDLTDFIGGNITVAFHYTSSDAGAATWRIDYARIVEEDDGFSDEPFVVEPVSSGSTGIFALIGLLALGLRRRLA